MYPGAACAVGCLKRRNLMLAPQRQCDFIETFEKSGAAARIDLKTVPHSRWGGNGLLLQIDADAPRALRVLDLRGKTIDNLLVDHDGEDSVLEAVGEENVAEAGTDNSADTHFLQRPDRRLPRGAATEVRTRDQDFSPTVRLAVQDEFRILRAVRQIAQRTKTPFSEIAANRVSDDAFDADDDVGIDVGAHDRRGNRR